MTTYKESGVDINAGTEAISRIKKHVQSTFSDNVLTDLGGFGGCLIRSHVLGAFALLISSLVGSNNFPVSIKCL